MVFVLRVSAFSWGSDKDHSHHPGVDAAAGWLGSVAWDVSPPTFNYIVSSSNRI